MLTTSYPTFPGDFRGGFVEDLAQGLASIGHEVQVLVPHPGGDAQESESSAGVTVERVRSPRLLGHGTSAFGELGVLNSLAKNPGRAAEIALALAALARRALEAAASCDLVITHWLVPGGVIGAALSHVRGIPHIAIEHGGGARVLSRMPGRSLALGFILSGSTAVQLVSQQLKEQLARAVPSSRDRLEALSLVFPAPLPGEPPAQSARPYMPPPRILFVGRLIEDKGIETLLAALGHLRHARLTVVGDGPQRMLAETTSQESELSSRVTLTGLVPRPDMDAIYRAHDILVIPSLAGPFDEGGRSGASGEGVPRVLLEGMAAGLVPVCSKVGGMPEVIRDGENGLLFPPGDSDALARCLRSLANNPKLCARLAARARRDATRYTLPSLLKLLDNRLRGEGIELRLARPVR